MSFEVVEIGPARLVRGDCAAVLPTLDADSADAVVTDPPAGIKFMGVGWDSFADRKGSKGHDPSITFDKLGGNSHPRSGFDRGQIQRSEGRRFREQMTPLLAECLRIAKPGAVALVWAIPRTSHWTAMALEDAGWDIEDRIAHLFGTGFPKHKSKLKPACEDWWVCRKPGPKWLGVERCRVGVTKRVPGSLSNISLNGYGEREGRTGQNPDDSGHNPDIGRWPANVILDEAVAAELDEASGKLGLSGGTEVGTFRGWEKTTGEKVKDVGYGDSGGASRYFYVAKADKADRGRGNKHPTVKSTALMRWLVRLACPEGGLVLDPFAGSFSTGKAAVLEGCRFVGIEREEGYFRIGCKRMEAAVADARSSLFPPAPVAAPVAPAARPGLFPDMEGE